MTVIGKQGDNVTLAIAVIVFTVFSLSLGDALVKKFSGDFNLWQIFVLRAVFAVPFLLVVMKFQTFRKSPTQSISLIPQNLLWTTLRSLMLVLMWVIYYFALTQLTFSVAAAVYYTLPIFITLFAALFAGDKLTANVWLAIALGSIGVLLILRPQVGDFNLHALLPLIAAILYALAMVITRTRCRNEHPLLLSLALNLAFPLIGGLVLLFIFIVQPQSAHYEFILSGWRAMSASDWLLMSVLATSILIGSIGAATAYQLAPPSSVSAFEFSYLAFAVLWGVFLFSEIPDAITLLGMVLITIGGLRVLRA